ncbi:hypothetical protein [Roseibacillus persicicus]|uniref:Uncharacterized protein n=1 Tax=Roseibacillus persicicus TaxID=454148 RepID=A0A918TTS8_9BACT|nr:hypothetical protein [Roseibacillus persicicus]GHC61582.1 hypothetical protein GCM10007100_31190 [Roseibacillus persicicus]
MKLLVFALLSPACWAIEVPLDFTIQNDSKANLTYRVGTGLTAIHQEASFQDIHTAEVAYSGNILAIAEVNDSTGSIDGIRFTGGAISTAPTAALLEASVGNVPFQITFQAAGLVRTASSNEMQVLSGGILDGDVHFTTLTSGLLEVSNYSKEGHTQGTVTETVDFATGSSDLISGESLFPTGTGASSVGSTQTGSNLFTKDFSASLFSIIQVPTQAPDAQIQAAGLPSNQQFKQRYLETGALSASTTFSIPTAFGQWALDNGLDLTTGQEKNEAGFPYAVLFALGLPGSSTSLPITFDHSGGPSALLTAPASGLGFPIQVLYSPDLETDFTPLNSSYLPGNNPISRGTSGSIAISFPTLETGFLRFAVNL